MATSKNKKSGEIPKLDKNILELRLLLNKQGLFAEVHNIDEITPKEWWRFLEYALEELKD